MFHISELHQDLHTESSHPHLPELYSGQLEDLYSEQIMSELHHSSQGCQEHLHYHRSLVHQEKVIYSYLLKATEILWLSSERILLQHMIWQTYKSVLINQTWKKLKIFSPTFENLFTEPLVSISLATLLFRPSTWHLDWLQATGWSPGWHLKTNRRGSTTIIFQCNSE
jgi:hypothetical protein